jgi:transcriptional regulator with XRE-family HTH domain
MLETMTIIQGMTNKQQPDSPARRISLRLWQLGMKQKRIAEELGYSSGFISDVVNGKKELGWDDTKKLASLLSTTTDYILGLREDPEPFTDKELAPFYNHEESDQLAQLADAQPLWLREQLVAVARAQVESIKEGSASTSGPVEQLREALRMAALVLGEDEVNRIINGSVRQLQPAGTRTRDSYRQLALGKS